METLSEEGYGAAAGLLKQAEVKNKAGERNPRFQPALCFHKGDTHLPCCLYVLQIYWAFKGDGR